MGRSSGNDTVITRIGHGTHPACQSRMIIAECPLYRPLLVSGPLHRVIGEGDCQCQTNSVMWLTLSES